VTETAIPLRPTEDAGTRPLIGWGAARRRAKAAHDAEFTAFVESASTRLRRSAFLMCRDWHLAQDLTQQTFTKMYAAWPRIRTGTNWEAYSRKVLMNLVFDQSRRRSASEVVLADLPDHVDRANGTLARLRALLGDDFRAPD
jgi:DNA-directed RNA polymerase specialized sigma24 family protein